MVSKIIQYAGFTSHPILLQGAREKIKQQVNININAKMQQSVDGGSSHVTRMKKRVSSSVIAEESELPRKSRRLELNESALPRGEAVSEVDEIGPNIPCTNDAKMLERNDISVRVMNVAKDVHQPNRATKAVPERLTIVLRSSASKMTTTPQKHVLKYTLLIY
jgi:hypothetical protein